METIPSVDSISILYQFICWLGAFLMIGGVSGWGLSYGVFSGICCVIGGFFGMGRLRIGGVVGVTVRGMGVLVGWVIIS